MSVTSKNITVVLLWLASNSKNVPSLYNFFVGFQFGFCFREIDSWLVLNRFLSSLVFLFLGNVTSTHAGQLHFLALWKHSYRRGTWHVPVDGMSKDRSGLASVYPSNTEPEVQDALAIHLLSLLTSLSTQQGQAYPCRLWQGKRRLPPSVSCPMGWDETIFPLVRQKSGQGHLEPLETKQIMPSCEWREESQPKPTLVFGLSYLSVKWRKYPSTTAR